MDVVPGTVELPGKKIQKQFEKAIDPSCATVKALLRAHDISGNEKCSWFSQVHGNVCGF